MEPNGRFDFLYDTRGGRWCIYLVWALFVSHLWLPRNWGFYGNMDWDLTYATIESARKCIVEFGQWPLFNPWSSFGTDLASNPQSVHGGIFFIPSLIAGAFYGFKISILLAMLAGVSGAYAFFRAMGNDKKDAVWGSILFGSATYFSAHIFEAGHSNFLYAYLIPWLAFSFARLQRAFVWKYWLLAVFLLSQMITGGAPFVFILSGGILGLWALHQWITEKKFRTVSMAISLGLAAIVLSMWKLYPVMQFWQSNPRLMLDASAVSPVFWLESLGGYEAHSGTWLGFWEYSLGFSLILVVVIWNYRNHIPAFKWWLVLFALVFWLCLGNNPPFFNPWYFLNHFVPVFDGLRAPSRFGLILVFGLCAAFLYLVKSNKDQAWLSLLLIAAAIGQSFAFHASAGKHMQGELMEQIKQPRSVLAKNTMMDKTGKGHQYLLTRSGHLVMNAYEPLALPAVTDSTPVFLTGGKLIYFSPNRLTIHLTDSIATLHLRYSDGWKCSSGAVIRKNQNGLMEIKGKGAIELNYQNPSEKTGLWLVLLLIPIGIASRFLLGNQKDNQPE